MTDPIPPQTTTPARRASDATTPGGPPSKIDDAEAWYADLRSGARPIAEIATLAPLDVIFGWYAQRKVSEAEFAALMAAQEVHEVVITDIAASKNAELDAEQKRNAALVSAFKARLGQLDQSTPQNESGEEDMRAVLAATQPLPDGVGLRVVFVAPATPPEGSGPLPPPGTTLTLLCRAYVGSASVRSAVKCEAVFASPALPGEFYCRIVVPLPVMKGGRRRLSMSVLDNETRRPVKLPPEIAELFHEKFIQELHVLRKPAADSGGLGGLVKGTLGRILGR